MTFILRTGHLLGTLVPNMVEQNQVNILFQSGPENLIIGEGTTVINKGTFILYQIFGTPKVNRCRKPNEGNIY